MTALHNGEEHFHVVGCINISQSSYLHHNHPCEPWNQTEQGRNYSYDCQAGFLVTFSQSAYIWNCSLYNQSIQALECS